MSRMIVLLSVVIVLFAVAAGGSWYLQSLQSKDAEVKNVPEDKPSKSSSSPSRAKSSGGEDSLPNRPIIRNSTPPDTDRLTQLASALQRQQEEIKEKEQRIAVREKQMDIQDEELKKLHKQLEVRRKEIATEMAALQEKLEMLEKRTAEGDKDRKATDAQRKELERTILEVESYEVKNLKDQSKTMEKMDPEAAALVVVQMVDQGKLDTAAKMLSQMRDRQAAAILGEITKEEPRLSAQLFERMRTLKIPTVAAPK
jgi:DNA repair exonuclease SbcCD ATPase subunit